MLIILIEAVMGAFVSNFKTEKHPYLVCFLKGFFIGIIGFILALATAFFKKITAIPFESLLKFFIVTQIIGFFVSIIFLIIELVFPDKK